MYVALYFLVSYTVTVLVSGICLAQMTRASWRRRQSAFILGIYCVPLLPYAWVEAHTWVCRGFLKRATEQSLAEDGYSTPIASMKVLAITPWRAHVYAVTPCYEKPTGEYCAVVLTLIRRHGHWTSGGFPDAVWSDCGSADGTIFPPYAGKGEFSK